MSPEQLAGVSSQKLEAATDVYGLGVLLYEMAEGRDPLGLRRHEDLLVVLRAKREKRPRKMRKLRHAELSELILSTLEPDPEDRPDSMEALSRRLRRIARAEGAVRADLEYLARVAIRNCAAKEKASGARAPTRPEHPDKGARGEPARRDDARNAARKRRASRTAQTRASRAGATRARAGARAQAAARSA